MGVLSAGRAGAGPAGRHLIVLILVALVIALVLSQALISVSFNYAAMALSAAVLFGLAFVRTDFGIYVVVFSMLLSPEFGAGGGNVEGRSGITLRAEDFVLLVIGLSWFAKTALNKELGLVAKTPLNRPILVYIAANAFATVLGGLLGNVGQSGMFYVLKYIEYFFVYYMVVNNVSQREQAWKMMTAAFLTAVVVSLVGLSQVPSGQRVSAPFEGEAGEPNTFGGYLLLMMALAGALALETTVVRTRVLALAMLGLMAIPFAFTLSRASYLGVVPAILVLTALTRRRRFMVGLLLLGLLCSPIVAYVAPKSVVNRVLYTFEEEKGQATVRLGKVGLDPSTSARLITMRLALEGWLKRPILGYGVTGFGFMDSQFARALVETGAIGLGALLWLLWSVLRSGRSAAERLRIPEDRAIAVGFVAGTVGLLFHALGSNTFIIVRIMEPFWFFAGMVMILPTIAPTMTGAPLVRPVRPGARG